MESLGDDAAAVAQYTKAIELNEARKGRYVLPYVNLSAFYLRQGNENLAFEFAQKAYGLNPNSDGALFQLGKIYDRRNELEAAAEALKKAIALNPRSSASYYVLGGVYRKLGKTQESQAAIEEFRRLGKESAEFEQKRREVFRNEGRKQ
jgi:tetratricopeptide (TPR) repeat protein